MAQFNHDGIKLYYEVKGNQEGKETVVFLNGVMASTNSWSYQVPVFEKMGYKIILHDFRGQMRSDKPEGPYSFKTHAEDTIALLNFLEVKSAHLIGTSYGGEVGMQIAIVSPNLVKSLSVVNSVSELDEKLRVMVKGWRYLAQGDPYEYFMGIAPTVYGKSYMENNKEFLIERAKGMHKLPKDFFMGQVYLYDTFDQLNMTNEIDKISCPTLVVCGEEDILKERKFSKIIADHIKGSEYAIIPDCGHVTIWEKPNILNSLLLGFVVKNT